MRDNNKEVRRKINSRAKGNTYERRIAAIFTDMFGIKFARVPNSGGLYIKGDIMPENSEPFPFVVECKNQKAVKIHEWEHQLLTEMAAMKKYGILVFHRHGTDEDYAYVPYFPHVLSDEHILFVRGHKFRDLETQKIFSFKDGYVSTLQKILLAIKFYLDRGEKYEYKEIFATKND